VTQWNESDPRNLDPFSAVISERQLARTQDRLALANKDTGLNSLSHAGGTPPIVTGTELVSNVGNIHVKWVRSTITDLKFYQIQIATNSDFTQNVITKNWQDTEYIWEEGSEDETYYIRVRAVNTANNAGPWSARVNSLTGKVYTAIIDVDATTNVVRFVYGDDPGENFSVLNSNGATEDYGNLTIDVFDDDSVVSPSVIFTFDYASNYVAATSTMNFTVSMYRREQGDILWGAAINSAQQDLKSTIGNVGTADYARAQVPTFVNFDEPGQGIWEYKINVTVNFTGGSNAIYFQGNYLEMEFWQTKR
jgi:hypothetical protein